ncbi:MAG: M20/M25/M40 family metallo-hydrolase [Anaerolineales bacterium]
MDVDRVISRAIAIQQIPGPTFEEARRSEYLQEQFTDMGLDDVSVDSLGNVFGRTPAPERPILAVSAHLDSVFPLDTNLDIKTSGSDLIGPGIGDNAIALALMLEIAEQFMETPPAKGLWFVGNVREEGLGNLEGMHQVVTHFGEQVRSYIVLEGIGLGHIYHRGLQVQRYRISVETQGGHAWIHAGQESAIHTLIQIGSEIISIPRPVSTQSSLNVGKIHGGTSINTIADSAYFDLDLRSKVDGVLEQLEGRIENIIRQYRSDTATVNLEIIGHRPGGEISADHKLVQLACQALSAGEVNECILGIASTDANVPLSKGIPAICVGLTQGGNAHTPREFINTDTLSNGYKMLEFLLRGALELPG